MPAFKMTIAVRVPTKYLNFIHNFHNFHFINSAIIHKITYLTFILGILLLHSRFHLAALGGRSRNGNKFAWRGLFGLFGLCHLSNQPRITNQSSLVFWRPRRQRPFLRFTSATDFLLPSAKAEEGQKLLCFQLRTLHEQLHE